MLTGNRKSKLRTERDVELGPRYAGASIGRYVLNDDSSVEGISGESDVDRDGLPSQVSSERDSGGKEDPWREYGAAANVDGEGPTGDSTNLDGDISDQSQFEDSHRGSGTDSENEDQDGISSQSQSENSSITSSPSSPSSERAALRKLLASEQKTAAVTISKAAQNDIGKGRALKRQRSTFDTLLNTRMKLQKGLIATNSLPSTSLTLLDDHKETIRAAEDAALKLWNSLTALRSSLHPPNSSKVPAFGTLDARNSSTTSSLLAEILAQESLSLPHRRQILTKWSQKTQPPSATIPRQSKFSQTPSQQPLVSVLDQQLAPPSIDRLIARTRVPRSCAPLQHEQQAEKSSISGMKKDEGHDIYDDADFYTLLLRELVDQRMATSTSTNSAYAVSQSGNGIIGSISLPSSRDLKIKKQVDTKASKGRKMRYNVHEKLQNFMASDDRGSWGERQRKELFGSLFGRRVGNPDGGETDDRSGGERNEEGYGGVGVLGDMDLDGDEGLEGGGLRLFG